MKFDFGGYATKSNVRCSDGRTIDSNAFKDCDGMKVPMVWNHLRDDPKNVVGYAILEHRNDGVYAYGVFNDSEKGQLSKHLVEHGDITALSIYANHLTHRGSNVTHGIIREVSLVMAGANPEALIDNISISHSDGSIDELEDEAIIYFDCPLEHSVEYDMVEEFEHEDIILSASVYEKLKNDLRDACQTLNKEAGGRNRFTWITRKKVEDLGTQLVLVDTKTNEDYVVTSSDDVKRVVNRLLLNIRATKKQDEKIRDQLSTSGSKSEQRELKQARREWLREKKKKPLLHGDASEGDEIEYSDEENQNKDKEKTVKDVFDSLTDDQKALFYAMVGQALEEGEDDEDVEQSDYEEGGNYMKKNVFEGRDATPSLSHADRVEMFRQVQKYATDNNLKLSKAFNEHADSFLEHGITDIESLFPDYKSLNNPPAWIGEPEAWVNVVWNGTSKTPFARIKSAFADITKDEARARGYIKGKKKEEEQFSLMRRTTDPQTVYKLQKLDRDDIIDITDFDVVAWLKSEMRMKLQEELARAILIGDGRSPSAEQKIQESHIRPILTDDVFYTLKYQVDLTSAADSTDRANAVIDAAAYAMIDYKGSGGLTAFMSPQILADMKVAKDKNGRRLYTSVSEIASALGVSSIVEVPLMKDQTRKSSTIIGDADDTHTYKTLAVLVNLRDYTVGADRGGQTTMFDDFDIDYNKYTYLIETRCSGALIRPASAIVIETDTAAG